MVFRSYGEQSMGSCVLGWLFWKFKATMPCYRLSFSFRLWNRRATSVQTFSLFSAGTLNNRHTFSTGMKTTIMNFSYYLFSTRQNIALLDSGAGRQADSGLEEQFSDP